MLRRYVDRAVGAAGIVEVRRLLACGGTIATGSDTELMQNRNEKLDDGREGIKKKNKNTQMIS